MQKADQWGLFSVGVAATFGALLRAHRLRAGLTQEELAEASGVSARTISLLETGKRDAPRLASARLLAEALALSANEREALLSAATGHVVDQVADRGATDRHRVVPSLYHNGFFLPRGVPDFVGRAAELDRLLRPVSAASAGTVAVTTIDGMAGVGKSAFALHAAHALADRYPDGKFFYDLHGFTPNHDPVDPATALEALLRMAGVPAGLIPTSLAECSATWWAVFADRRVLLVLDNAADPGQVDPLLTGTPGSCVLVTSRRRLASVDAATPISLGLMHSTEAIALFAEMAGPDRTRGQRDVIAEIVELCGYLPMAIRGAAARLRNRPAWTVSRLAERLRDHRRLSELDAGGYGVTTALALSYRPLNADQRRLLTLLARHPGADFDADSIAALADFGIRSRRVERLLDDLVDHHLLMEPVAGRYVLHDLFREHVRAMAVDRQPQFS